MQMFGVWAPQKLFPDVKESINLVLSVSVHSKVILGPRGG